MFLNVGKTGICMMDADSRKGMYVRFLSTFKAIVVWKTKTYKGQETQEWKKVST